MPKLKVIGIASLAGLLTVLVYWVGIVIAAVAAILSVVFGFGLVFLLIYVVLRSDPETESIATELDHPR